MDVGSVFSTAFAMFRALFWPLLGMELVFYAIQTAGSMVLGIGMVALGLGAGALGAELESPASAGGLGVGMVVFMVVFYGAYIVLILAQQAAMVTLASPLEEPVFAVALVRGFKSALPFCAIAIVLILGWLLPAMVLGGIAGLSGEQGAGAAVLVILPLLLFPVLAYLAFRLAVLVPVVAVEQVYNPLAAIRRSWAVTRGKVLSIFLAFLGFMLLSMLALALPLALIFGGVFAAQDTPGVAAGVTIVGVLLCIPLFFAYTVFAATFTAAMHCQITGGRTEGLEEVFA